MHGRLPSLTGLRFIAALLVFGYHSSLALPALNPFASDDVADGYRWLFSNAGWAGVTFFFILSGFVLTWSARSGDRPRHFWRRRFFKVYPNHLVTWVLALVLLTGAATQWWQAVPNLFLVHAWVPEFSVFLGVNPPSWSLACELFFYLCFPLFLRWIKRIPSAHLWRWAIGTAAAVIAVPALAYLLLPGDPPMPEGSPASVWQYWSVYMLPPVRAMDFVLGMLMARIVLTGVRFRVKPLPAALACVAAYALSLYIPWLYALDAVFVIPMALLIPAVAMADVEGRPSLLRNRFLHWLGEVSFAFYMVHLILLNVVRELLGPDLFFGTAAGFCVLLLEAVATLGVAWLMYVAVERPAMNRWGRPRKKVTA
ncbi:acyltransferase [Streptomyces sp. NBC_00440]|uniref:acyltransferase family protein n=1 Tax=unclassified Streptomyces TaxID=2593676 RepID=UPI002E1C3D85|nr:acyltransferase [Streptomyces sp. NBC_00932]